MNEVEKAQACAIFLAKRVVDAGATTGTITVNGATYGDEQLGDFEITVKRVAPVVPTEPEREGGE